MSRADRAAQLRARIATLDAMRMARPLTPEERAEADQLTHRLYMSEYHRNAAGRLTDSRRRARMITACHG
ncbi:hypothetical protein GTZ99_03000 [Novosphingobium sp. FSY-8]|uniref:Uncharacterized protein n=1 Tax=Novosphingobium ovatum TaxID=1908523 RepID=A0ABW9XAF9_9SPHN|nr:hypothetical protein [Novosphingobium ovatum]NBC35519.1 hypothetical protein [Novosphingobium ovatum]